MNPQPPEYVGNIVAVLFACLVIFLTIREYLFGAIKYPSDKFVIGYFVDDNPNTKTIITDPPKQKNKSDSPKNVPTTNSHKPEKIKKAKTNKPKPQKSVLETDQLYLDCVDALYALGMKKLEAKKVTKDIFNSSDNRPSTIQDFLIIAMSKK